MYIWTRGGLGNDQKNPCPKRFSNSEIQMIQQQLRQGPCNENKLTDLVFFERHPERQGNLLDPDEARFKQLHDEWLCIRNRLIQPAILKKSCKRSQIRIEVRKPKDLSNAFAKDAIEALLAGSAIQILVHNTATSVSQNELIDATLKWACPSGKSDTERGTRNIRWTRSEADRPLETTRNGHKLALDGHVFGLSVKPGSDLLKSAETKGFDSDKCNWEFATNFCATTSADSSSKHLDHCIWGFRFVAKQDIAAGRMRRRASVKYWGVDQEITTP